MYFEWCGPREMSDLTASFVESPAQAPAKPSIRLVRAQLLIGAGISATLIWGAGLVYFGLKLLLGVFAPA